MLIESSLDNFCRHGRVGRASPYVTQSALPGCEPEGATRPKLEDCVDGEWWGVEAIMAGSVCLARQSKTSRSTEVLEQQAGCFFSAA